MGGVGGLAGEQGIRLDNLLRRLTGLLRQVPLPQVPAGRTSCGRRGLFLLPSPDLRTGGAEVREVEKTIWLAAWITAWDGDFP
jgi:hypothetical protein